MFHVYILLALLLASVHSLDLPSCGATSKAGAENGFSKYTANAYKISWDKTKTEAENKAAGACQIAGYAVGSDVTALASLDLDQKAFEAKINIEDWDAAGKIYEDGDMNSMKSSGAARTLQGLSTNLESDTIATDDSVTSRYKKYWDVADFADKFVQAALSATTLPLSNSNVRAELLKKSTVYQHVWLYSLHKLDEAIEACKGATASDNSDGVHAWDAGWALYAGSQQSAGEKDGYMIYNLAQSYCSKFGTCTTDSEDSVTVAPVRTTRVTEAVATRPTTPVTPTTTTEAADATRTIKVETPPDRVVQTATREPVTLTTPVRTRRTRQTVRQTRMAAPTRAPAASTPQRRRASQTAPVAKSNKHLLNYFNQGRDFLVDGKCVEASDLIPQIVSQMTVPLIQGTLHYAYESDLWKGDQREVKCSSSVVESAANKRKEIAAGWAFAAALIPQLHHCDANKAKLIREDMSVDADIPVQDSYSKVAYVLQSMYPCLGVTCADIGGLKNDAGTYFPGLEPCDDAQGSRTFTPPSAPCPPDTTTSATDTTPTGAGADPTGADPTADPKTEGSDPQVKSYVAAAFVSSELMLTVVISSFVALMM